MDKIEKAKTARRAREKRARDQLSDSYVRKLIIKKDTLDLRHADIPEVLFIAKRLVVVLDRLKNRKESAAAEIETIERLHPELGAISVDSQKISNQRKSEKWYRS